MLETRGNLLTNNNFHWLTPQCSKQRWHKSHDSRSLLCGHCASKQPFMLVMKNLVWSNQNSGLHHLEGLAGFLLFSTFKYVGD